MKRLAGVPAVAAVPAVAVLALTAACARSRASEAPAPSRVVLPYGYDPSERYPVVVMLPASNGTAEAMWRSYPSLGDVVTVLAAGTGTTDDYRTPEIWERTIERYEGQLRADLARLFATTRVDTARVVLAGFSMGGDLAWALTVRNPALIKGAVVMGSRMSYPGTAEELATIKSRRDRFVIIMGERDEEVRRRGAEAANRLLTSLGTPHRYVDVPDLNHLRAPAGVFRQALEYVLADST